MRNNIFSDTSEVDQSQMCSTNWEESNSVKRKISNVSDSMIKVSILDLKLISNIMKSYQC